MPRGLMRWSPRWDLERFFGEGFGEEFGLIPAMNVYQDKENVIAEMAIPGIDAEKINISIENDVLTVSGSVREKEEIKKEDYYRKEIREGSFSRSVILPMAVKADQAEANYKKGILKITMPKSEEAKPKKIEIKVQD